MDFVHPQCGVTRGPAYAFGLFRNDFPCFEHLQIIKPSNWKAGSSPSTRRILGPPVVPFSPLFGEKSPTKIDYRKKGLILTSLLEDLG